jgi:hypothetical protein
MYGPAFKNANIAKTYIRNAYVTRFALGYMEQVHVDNSTLHRSGFFKGGIEELSVTNSTIDEIVGKNIKADIILWDNVTLDGKIDLTNAQVKDFRPTHLKRGPRLNLITTGSNLKLPFPNRGQFFRPQHIACTITVVPGGDRRTLYGNYSNKLNHFSTCLEFPSNPHKNL